MAKAVNITYPLNKKKHWLMKKDIMGWMIMLPTIILFAFFVWVPLFESVGLSLFKANGYHIQHFVGLDNYAQVLKHPDFMPALLNTFKYIFWSLIIGFITPILMAILITETVHFKSFYKIGVYFPNIMPGLAVVMMFRFFFRPGHTGVLNILLDNIGIDPVNWLTTPKITIIIIVIAMTWRSAGSTSLIYIAGINGINPELYEAATLDGAKILQRIRYITIPNIVSLGKTLLILQIIAVFQILYEPLVMTNGGPNNASISIMMLVYNYAFRDFNYPCAAALSAMICVILVILSVLYLKLTRSKEA